MTALVAPAVAWPAAVCPLAVDLVHGPPVTTRAVAVFADAVYLLVEEGAGVGPAGRVLALLAPGALAVPGSVRLAHRPEPWPVRVAETVRVGDGVLALPGAVVRVVRTARPSRVRRVGRSGTAGSVAARARLTRPDGEAHDVLAERGSLVTRSAVVARLLAAPTDSSRRPIRRPGRRPVGLAEALQALVGDGAGLTPSGDDALAAVLLYAHATGAEMRSAELTAVVHRTTALSATLLEAARCGHAVPSVVALLDAVTAGDGAATTRALPAVLAIGHSTGADLVAGLVGALSLDREGDAR